jgi:hypothetical protein
MSIKGFPSNQKLPLGSGITSEHVTVQPTDEFRNVLDTTTRFAFRVGGNTPRVAAANTGNIDGFTWVYDTNTPARRGDFVRFETGAAQFKEVAIIKVETNRFLLGAFLSPPPAPNDTFFIMRYATQRVDQDGSQLVSITPSPTSFVLDGTTTNVQEDTSIPANSKPLPVKVLDSAGLVPDFATQATLLTRATEATALAIKSDTAAIAAKDFATETTLVAVDTKLNFFYKTDGVNDFCGVGGKISGSTWKPINVSSNGDVFIFEQGRSTVHTVRHVYSSTPVNTTNWQQIISSVSAGIRRIEIFDSSGQTLELGTGAAGSETRRILIFPGGNGFVPLSISTGARVSIRAVSGIANEGEILINFYS